MDLEGDEGDFNRIEGVWRNEKVLRTRNFLETRMAVPQQVLQACSEAVPSGKD